MSEEVMTTATAAPASEAGGESSAPATLETAGDIAAALGGMDAEAGEDQGKEASGPAPASVNDAPAEAGEPAAEEGAEGAPETDGYVPEGWEASAWEGVPEAARGVIREREKAHAEALRAEIDKGAKIREDALALQRAANAQCGEAEALMRSIVEAEYGGIDWSALKASDPKAFVELQDRFRQRIAGINTLQAKIGESADAMRQLNARRREAEIAGEAARTVPVLAALMGQGFDPKRHVKDLAEYMTAHGVPVEAQNSMSRGYEMEFVTKAMLWDRQEKARAEAAKKVAEAPRVSQPKGGREDGNSAAYQRAKERLRAHSSSTEALAALLGTM